MQRNAKAQLYVTQGVGFGPAGTVTAYDANSGAVIPSSGFTPITGLNGPVGLAVANNNLYVANRSAGTVTAYIASSGLPAPKFTTITGLKKPTGLAVRGNVLYVSAFDGGTVTAYDANTGAPDQNFTPITGLNKPSGLAVGGQNVLYVASFGTSFGAGTIGSYDATEGGAFNPTLIGGLNGPSGVVWAGGTLFVSDEGSGMVGACTLDPITGNGTAVPGFIKNLNGPTGLVVTGPGNGSYLFVVSTFSGTVGEYDVKTGAPIQATFLSNLNGPSGLAVKSASAK